MKTFQCQQLISNRRISKLILHNFQKRRFFLKECTVRGQQRVGEMSEVGTEKDHDRRENQHQSIYFRQRKKIELTTKKLQRIETHINI